MKFHIYLPFICLWLCHSVALILNNIVQCFQILTYLGRLLKCSSSPPSKIQILSGKEAFQVNLILLIQGAHSETNDYNRMNANI